VLGWAGDVGWLARGGRKEREKGVGLGFARVVGLWPGRGVRV
jgi:hypothetical protein